MLCDEHKLALVAKMSVEARRAARFNPLDSFPGICYAIGLPNGLVKVGYSNSNKYLKSRLKDLKTEYGEPTFTATLPGGFVAEAVLHAALAQYRLPGRGELFDCPGHVVLKEIERLSAA
ncbi:GIY-YIG nuclease family protein [Mycobacterium sp. IS-836]|uniref:GIY-YIG nuclease family protein n=1 Tax=Mycobacterium sp. IS-836 TaxID=1834160 RepID=UPI00350F9D14